MTYSRTIEELTQQEALDLGYLTITWKGCQVSLLDIPGRSGELYLVNWITDPLQRGQGHARALLERVLWLADDDGVTLVTHPDDERLCAGIMRHGFVADSTRDTWQGKPPLVRSPRTPGPRPLMDHLIVSEPR